MTRSTRAALRRALFILMILLAALYGLKRAGWLPAERGRFDAVDGDSLRKGATEYRLNGIDAPELHQACADAKGQDYPCGFEARAALRQMVAGQQLDCTVIDTDRYHRLVAICRAGGTDINAAMVRGGWAIAYRRHSLAYVGEEREARANKRGIWRGQFETPEDWRGRHRNGMAKGGMDGDAIPFD